MSRSTERSFEDVVNTLPKLKWEGREGWRDEAECKNLDIEMFFGPEGRRASRKVCADCPVRMDCLEFALVNGIEYGMYGGLTAMERARISVDDIYI